MPGTLRTIKSTWKVASSVIAGACLFAFASTASAVPFTNPDPGTLMDDIDGSGYFSPSGLGSLVFELFDLGDTAAEFGGFDKNDPGTLIPFFEASDLTGEAAMVDFTGGFVFDVEDNAIQSVFAPIDSVGFYLDLPGLGTLFSDPTLNLGGVDVMAAHPTIGQPFTSLIFYDGPAGAAAPATLMSWHLISDVTGGVPLPSSAALLALGLLALRGKRTHKR